MTYEEAKAALEAMGFAKHSAIASHQFPGALAHGFHRSDRQQAVIYEPPKDHKETKEIMDANEWSVEQWILIITMAHCS